MNTGWSGIFLGESMGNILNVCRKELRDILSSNLFLIALAFYLFIIIFTLYSNVKSGTDISGISTVLSLFLYSTCYYSTLVAMAMGYSSFFSEIDGNAINTLLTKPVYRDQIINGKFISATILSIGVFAFSTILILLAILIYFVDPTTPILLVFYIIPVLFVLSILCNMFFYSLTMLICIFIKDQILSLFMSFLSWIILFYILENAWFSGYISYYFHDPGLANTISSFSPIALVNSILTSQNIVGEIVTGANLDLIKLVIYTVIIMFMTYSIFIRRDIS